MELEIEGEIPSPETQLFNKEDIQLFPAGRHMWRQQGPYVVCRGCELTHAIYVGMDKLMVGEDQDGKPVIKSRQEVFGNQ